MVVCAGRCTPFHVIVVIEEEKMWIWGASKNGRRSAPFNREQHGQSDASRHGVCHSFMRPSTRRAPGALRIAAKARDAAERRDICTVVQRMREGSHDHARSHYSAC
jgi:hypothetical protein